MLSQISTSQPFLTAIGVMGATMQRPGIDEQKIRDNLKTKRNLLFKEFFGNPSNTRLAIEIRLIDDRIAELAAYLMEKKKRKN
jgi:hypothetical protein